MVNMFNRECFQKIEQRKKEKEIELKIIKESLERAHDENVEDLKTQQKFDIKSLKQGIVSDMEEGQFHQFAVVKNQVSGKLLQEEDFARKQAEMEGVRLHRKFEQQLQDERDRLETQH